MGGALTLDYVPLKDALGRRAALSRASIIVVLVVLLQESAVAESACLTETLPSMRKRALDNFCDIGVE
jgi:hypothetical protein